MQRLYKIIPAICTSQFAVYFAFIQLPYPGYAALIQAKSPTNCNVHLTESIFQTRSSSQDYISCQAFSIPYILSII